MKARLITYKEIYNKADCGTTSGSCKAWATKNLNASQPGYWTMTSSLDTKRFYNAIAIDNTRRRTTAGVNQAKYGIRPVIRLATANLRQGEETQQDSNADYNYTQEDIQTSDELANASNNSGNSCNGNGTWDFEYSGSPQVFNVPCSGRFKFEVWGAQGAGSDSTGNSSSGLGGKGGYSRGTVHLNSGTALYVYVGGQGVGHPSNVSGSYYAAGGWNGGGSAYGSSSGEPGNGGGGASDIRIGNQSLYARVIVAGGGGGGGEDSGDTVGAGGGTNGVSGGSGGTATQTYGGTGAVFGIGASSNNDGGGGGGGWYGGGCNGGSQSRPTYATGTDNQGAGGGSGYVYTSSTYSYYPSGCLLNSSYYLTDASTIAGNQSFASPRGGTEYGHAGNGYVRITYLGN